MAAMTRAQSLHVVPDFNRSSVESRACLSEHGFDDHDCRTALYSFPAGKKSGRSVSRRYETLDEEKEIVLFGKQARGTTRSCGKNSTGEEAFIEHETRVAQPWGGGVPGCVPPVARAVPQSV
jgi:hypothetical protein